MNNLNQGTKADQDKPRMDLIPPEAIFGLAEVLTFGATKYGDRNWEAGINYERLYGAAQRHLNSWQKGETFDPETGLSHIKHAMANLAFLSTFEERGMSYLDDRPIKQEELVCLPMPILEEKVEEKKPAPVPPVKDNNALPVLPKLASIDKRHVSADPPDYKCRDCFLTTIFGGCVKDRVGRKIAEQLDLHFSCFASKKVHDRYLRELAYSLPLYNGDCPEGFTKTGGPCLPDCPLKQGGCHSAFGKWCPTSIEAANTFIKHRVAEYYGL